MPIEIDPNEAWNAWQSKSIAHLYPQADALTINNYPPLYFYLLHGAASLGAEEIYTGRVISILASLTLSFLVYRAIVILGGAETGCRPSSRLRKPRGGCGMGGFAG